MGSVTRSLCKFVIKGVSVKVYKNLSVDFLGDLKGGCSYIKKMIGAATAELQAFKHDGKETVFNYFPKSNTSILLKYFILV